MRSRFRSVLSFVALALVLWCSTALGGLKTATQNGNISNSATFGGSAFNSGDLLNTSTFAVTIDQNTTVGVSAPAAPTSQMTVTTTASATGLASGAHSGWYFTYVDSNGAESPPSPVMGGVTVTNGTNTARWTFPSALPTGVTSRSLYGPAQGGAFSSATRYATGITTLTYDCTSASWENGTLAQASAPALDAGRNYAVTVAASGSLTVSAGVQLTVKGDFRQGGNVTLGGALAGIEFDPSGSIGTTATKYGWFGGTAGNQNITISSSGLDLSGASTHCYIRAKSGSYVFRFLGGNGDANIFVHPLADSLNFNLAGCRISRCGDNAIDGVAWTFSASTKTQTFTDCVFDAGGAHAGTPTTSVGFDYRRVSFTNSNPRTVSSQTLNLRLNGTAGVISAASRRFQVSSDLSCTIPAGSTDDSSVWLQAPTVSATAAMQKTQIANSLIQWSSTGGFTSTGDHLDCVFLANPAKTQSDSGTCTGTQGTSLEFIDTSKTWGTNAYKSQDPGSTPASKQFAIIITGGTGVGQVRYIFSNTATKLTLYQTWAVQPVAGSSTYKIAYHDFNMHGCNFPSISGSAGVVTAATSTTLTDSNKAAVVSTTIASAANSNTQTLTSVTNFRVGDVVVFAESTTTVYTVRNILSINVGAKTITVDGGAVSTKTTDLCRVLPWSGSNNYTGARVVITGGTGATTGTATGGTRTTLVDSGASWTTNQWAGYSIYLTGGTGYLQWGLVLSNTSTTLTLNTTTVPLEFYTPPDATTTYAIGATSIIQSNTTSVLTCSPAFQVTPAASSTYRILVYTKSEGVVYEEAGWDNVGDAWLHPDSLDGCTYVLKKILLVKGWADQNPGTLITFSGNNSGGGVGADAYVNPGGSRGPVVVEGCTAFAGEQTPLAMAEQGPGYKNCTISFQNNLVWYRGGTTYAQCFKALDEYYLATPTSDIVAPNRADYNGGFNLNAGTALKGYNLNASVTPGAHDVSGDPGFVDPERNIRTFGTSLGLSGDALALTTSTLNAIAACYDPQNVNYLAGATPALYRDHVRAGYAPTSASYRTAGYDGGVIGAVAWLASSTTAANNGYISGRLGLARPRAVNRGGLGPILRRFGDLIPLGPRRRGQKNPMPMRPFGRRKAG